jgi:hypothetical protein
VVGSSVVGKEVEHMTTTTIDCQTCPVRGRHCGDCFVPVLGRLWLEEPRPRDTREPTTTGIQREEDLTALSGVPLDSDELAAVSAFVRAGLVDPEEASRARAQLTATGRYAAG